KTLDAGCSASAWSCGLPGAKKYLAHCRVGSYQSHALDKTVQHPLLTCLVELNHEFVAFHVGNVAVAELEVKHPVADRVGRHCSSGFCNELTFDRERGGATGRTACAALGRASASLARARSVGEMARANCGGFGIVRVLVTRGCEWRGMLAVVDILVFVV